MINMLLLAGPFAGTSTTQLLMLILAVILLTVLMVSTGRRIRESRALTGKPARERYHELQSRQAARRDVEQATLELDQVARQVHAQIDTRLARLEALIRDADQRIARLSGLSSGNRPPASIEVTLDAESPADAPSTDAAAVERRFAAVFELADHGLGAREIAERVGRIQGEVELILGLRKTATHPHSAEKPVRASSA